MSSMYSNQLSYASVQRVILYHIPDENASPLRIFFLKKPYFFLSFPQVQALFLKKRGMR